MRLKEGSSFYRKIQIENAAKLYKVGIAVYQEGSRKAKNFLGLTPQKVKNYST